MNLRRVVSVGALLCALLVLLVAVVYLAIPTSNHPAAPYDVLIVLGSPANPNGTPSPEQRERVLEAIREYRAGAAPRLIMSGGAAHNQFVEAEVMARFAESRGVPASAIFTEEHAMDTIQNITYSARIMHAHGWSSAEIVSSSYHLRRAGLILGAFNRAQPALALQRWSTHASPWPAEYGFVAKGVLYAAEAWRCFWLGVLGFPASSFLPAKQG